RSGLRAPAGAARAHARAGAAAGAGAGAGTHARRGERAARALLETFDGDHAEVGRALAEPLRLLVALGLVEALRGLEALELEHDEPLRLPVSLEHRVLAAAREVPSAPRFHGGGRHRLVALVLLRVVDIGLDDQVCGHGWDSSLVGWRRARPRRPRRSRPSSPRGSCRVTS